MIRMLKFMFLWLSDGYVMMGAVFYQDKKDIIFEVEKFLLFFVICVITFLLIIELHF